MKKLAVEYRPVAALESYAKNARTHSERQVGQIVASIREFGWTNPILVDGKNGIIAGHGRLLAAKAMGVAEVPVIELSGLTAAQKRAYVIADNKLTLNGGWDENVLREELKALGESGFDLGLVGFDDVELGVLLTDKTDGLTDPDDVPETPTDPVTRLGDVWLCGKHRVMCGDSTVETDVAALLGDVKPHLMVTDPPYGVEYDASWRGKATSNDGRRVSLGVHAVGKVQNDDKADWRAAWALFPGDVAYVWHAGIFAGLVADSLQASGFKLRSQIIWKKNNFAFGRGDYHWHHEPCWYAVRDTGHWVGGRKQSTIWEIPKPQKSETGHSTQKPVECMKRPIENNSSPGQAVYDPFLGSGTTMIAGEMTGRHVYGVELSPAYVDVIVKRWQAFTGSQAILDGDSRTFDAIAAERQRKAA